MREELASKDISSAGIRDAIAAAVGVDLNGPQKLRGSSREYRDPRNYASGGTRLLPERTWLIGDSGEVYGVAAEAGKQEKITFEPTGKDIRKGTEGGFQEYQAGGSAYVYEPYPGANAARANTGGYDPWPGTAYSTNPAGAGDYMKAASEAALAAQQQTANLNELLRAGQRSAVNAQALSASNSAIAGLQAADVASRQQELGQLETAQANIPAEAAALAAQRQARAGDYKYGLGGLELPYEVTPSISGDMNYRLPMGVRYGFETPAQRLARQISLGQAQRGLGIQAAQAQQLQQRYPAPSQESTALTTVGRLLKMAGGRAREADLTSLMRGAMSGDWSGVARILGLSVQAVQEMVNADQPVLGAVA